MSTTDLDISTAGLGLLVTGPDPAHRDDLMLFGRFAGSTYDIRSVRFDRAAGAQPETALEWTFAWALDGRGIVDVLRGEGGVGTTVRIYHPSTRTWSVSWQSTISPHVFTLVAAPEGDRIVLRGEGPEGLEEWSFNEIEDCSFLWRSRVSADGGATWFVDQEMRARRRG